MQSEQKKESAEATKPHEPSDKNKRVATNNSNNLTYIPNMSLGRLHRREKLNMVRLGALVRAGPDHPLIKAGEAHHARKSRGNTNGWKYEPVYNHIQKLFQKLNHEEGTPYGWLASEFSQPHGDAGRLNSVGNMSLQVTARHIRHAVSSEFYIDIDAKNCHVVLLAHYCEAHKIRHSALKRMIKHRDVIFEDVMKKNPKLTREDVKQAVLALLNGGTIDYKKIRNKPDDLVIFAEEIDSIIKEVAKLNKALLIEVRKKRKAEKRDYNHEGAVMCRILQDLENQCLEAMEDACAEFGIPVEEMVPIHDGMQLPRSPAVEEKLDEILMACKKAIKDRVGVELEIVVKPMDSHLSVDGFEFPDDSQLEYCKPIEEESAIMAVAPFQKVDDIYDVREFYLKTVFKSYEDMVQDFLERLPRYVRRVNYPASYIVNKGCVNMGTAYREGWVLELEKEVNIKTRYTWVDKEGHEHIGIRTFTGMLENDMDFDLKFPMYKGITFNPNLENVDPRMFNMFNGFQAQEVAEVNMEYIQPLLDHILTCWCNGDDVVYRYVLQWFRQAFAQPWEKTGVVILLYGDEGTGKGTLIDKFIKTHVYGEANSLTIQGLSKIVQRFNSALMNKLLVCANEVNSGEGFHDTFDTLKALITDPTFCPEKKGLDVLKDYPVPCNFIFTTNNHNSVKLGKTDRRYLCLDTSNRYVGDREYFNRLYSFLAPSVVQRNADHFFTYCKQLEKVGELRDIPMTSLKAEMMGHAKSSAEMFLEDVLELFVEEKEFGDGWESVLKDIKPDEGKLTVSASMFYSSYRFWCDANHEKTKGHRDFGLEMKRLVGLKKTKKENVYIIPLPIGETEAEVEAEVEAEDSDDDL